SSVVCKMMAALPEKYQAFKTSFDSVDANNQTMEYLLQRLRKEAAQQEIYDRARNSNREKSKTKAYNAERVNKNGGFYKAGNGKQANNALVAYMAHVSELPQNSEDVWILDSGANAHISGRREWFSCLKQLDEPENIWLADKTSVQAKAIGNINVFAYNGVTWL